MSTRAALVTGTVMSLAVTAAWSWMASLAIGPAGPLHPSRNLASDYAQLAAAQAAAGSCSPSSQRSTQRACWSPAGAATAASAVAVRDGPPPGHHAAPPAPPLARA